MSSRDYLLDTSRWPLVRAVVPADHSDDAAFDRHLRNLRGILDRREPFVIVFDVRLGGNMPAGQRERLRDHKRAYFFEAQRYQRAVAFVVSSGFQRAVLAAIMWLAPEPCPSRIFSSVEEAEAWALTCSARSHAA